MMKAKRACGLYIVCTITFLPISAHAGWTPAVRISEEGTSFGPRVAADGDTVHVVYWTAEDRPYYLRSTDNGDNWQEPFCLMDTDTSATGVSPVIRSVRGSIFVVWYDRFRNSDRVNWGFRQSTNGGGSGRISPTFCLPITQCFKNIHFL